MPNITINILIYQLYRKRLRLYGISRNKKKKSFSLLIYLFFSKDIILANNVNHAVIVVHYFI